MSTPVGTDAVDVAIVGAGPVGLVLAIQLAQRGRSVTVLEQRPNPYALPRAVHFDHEVGRLLQSCGIGDELREISEPAEVYEWRNGTGTTLMRFGRIGTGLSGWPFSSMFSQPDLEALLRRRCEALPTLQCLRGARVIEVAQADASVTIDFVPVGEESGSPQSMQARYVVGCDGANSDIRTQLGVGSNDRGFFYDWLIVDVVLNESRVFDPINLQVCDPVRPTTAVSGGPGRRRWEFMRLPGEPIEELNQESRAWELLVPWDVHPENATLERHAVYTFQARAAEQWQVGRVFLAGDAAHQMPPFAGQGMCAGIRDAANLAWKLDLVLEGLAGHEILATYDEERRPSANAAIDFSMDLGKVICVPDPAEAAARDEAMAAGYDGGISEVPGLPGIASGLIAAGTTLAGEPCPQGAVEGRWFDDVHGVGWRLITVASEFESIDSELDAWFKSIGGAVVSVTDASVDLINWFGRHDICWALQRPDFQLFGTATNREGAIALLSELRNQLRPISSDQPRRPE